MRRAESPQAQPSDVDSTHTNYPRELAEPPSSRRGALDERRPSRDALPGNGRAVADRGLTGSSGSGEEGARVAIAWDGITRAETLGADGARTRHALAAKRYEWPRVFELLSKNQELVNTVNTTRPGGSSLYAPLHQASFPPVSSIRGGVSARPPPRPPRSSRERPVRVPPDPERP